MVSQSLIAFDTDHIKKYVFGTSKLKEIRGASSILDYLNRKRTKEIAEDKFSATTIYAHGGSALFLIASNKAEQLGREIQKLYHDKTGGGASITYAIQPIPEHGSQDIMTATRLDDQVKMCHVLKMLRLRLRQTKEGTRTFWSEKDTVQEDLLVAASAFPRTHYFAHATHAAWPTRKAYGEISMIAMNQRAAIAVSASASVRKTSR